jgi:hypothetical protein
VLELCTGALQIPESLSDLLPATERLQRQLWRILRPAYYNCDSAEPPAPPVVDDNLLAPGGAVMTCRAFVATLLSPLERCCVVLDRTEELLVAIDEERFERKAVQALQEGYDEDKNAKQNCEILVRAFLRSQGFSEQILRASANT